MKRRISITSPIKRGAAVTRMVVMVVVMVGVIVAAVVMKVVINALLSLYNSFEIAISFL